MVMLVMAVMMLLNALVLMLMLMTVIMMIAYLQILIRTINLDLDNKFCSTAEETSCPAADEDQGNNDEVDKNPLESSIFGDAVVEDDQSSRLNEVFWGDATRAATHERLEWWLAQIRNLNFPHLEEHLYTYVSVGSLELGQVQRKVSNILEFHFLA